MTNLQLLLSIGIPTFFVLAGILVNHREVSTLRTDMNRQFDRVDARYERMESHLSRIDQDLRNFHGTDKELEGRVNELSARMNQRS